MNIQYVRLDDDICEILNRVAEANGRRVSELVNERLREQLEKRPAASSAGNAAAD